MAFACADLVICRAGAGSVSELAALGLPAIYVPLPIGNGEQRFNAEPVVNAGGGLLVADKDLRRHGCMIMCRACLPTTKCLLNLDAKHGNTAYVMPRASWRAVSCSLLNRNR